MAHSGTIIHKIDTSLLLVIISWYLSIFSIFRRFIIDIIDYFSNSNYRPNRLLDINIISTNAYTLNIIRILVVEVKMYYVVVTIYYGNIEQRDRPTSFLLVSNSGMCYIITIYHPKIEVLFCMPNISIF